MGYALDNAGIDHVLESTRSAHRAYLEDHAETVVLAGRLLAPGDVRLGTCLIIAAADLGAAQKWFDNEPFNKAGVFKSVTVTRVAKGVWHPENAADAH